jgi:hypothetical protein
MSYFAQIAGAQSEITLLNIFKGVSISFPAQIIELGGYSIKIVADKLQIVSMYYEKKTFIQSPMLPELVEAEVYYIEPHSRIAILTQFTDIYGGIGNRTLVRVQPREPMECVIQSNRDGRSLRGELADVSQDGIAVYLASWMFSPRQAAKGDPYTITISLPGTYDKGLPKTKSLDNNIAMDRYAQTSVRFSPTSVGRDRNAADDDHARRLINPQLRINTELANVHLEESQNRFRLGLRIQPNDPCRAMLKQFITQRQSEIIREVKVMYDLLTKIADK